MSALAPHYRPSWEVDQLAALRGPGHYQQRCGVLAAVHTVNVEGFRHGWVGAADLGFLTWAAEGVARAAQWAEEDERPVRDRAVAEWRAEHNNQPIPWMENAR